MLKIFRMFSALMPASVLLITLSAGAAVLPVTSYTMYNGAHGFWNYRDFTYVPCNSVCNVTGTTLSGGTGKLTDGVSPSTSWYQEGEYTQWVGWANYQSNGLNPIVRFFFGSTVTVNSLTVWVDNTNGWGGVYLPSGVSIDGNLFTIAPDSTWGPRGYTFSGLNITHNKVDVQFFQAAGRYWVMVGEVGFDGTTTPEPSSLWLLGTGLIGAVGVIRLKINH